MELSFSNRNRGTDDFLENSAKFELERAPDITFLRRDHKNITRLGRSRRKVDAV